MKGSMRGFRVFRLIQYYNGFCKIGRGLYDNEGSLRSLLLYYNCYNKEYYSGHSGATVRVTVRISWRRLRLSGLGAWDSNLKGLTYRGCTSQTIHKHTKQMDIELM